MTAGGALFARSGMSMHPVSPIESLAQPCCMDKAALTGAVLTHIIPRRRASSTACSPSRWPICQRKKLWLLLSKHSTQIICPMVAARRCHRAHPRAPRLLSLLAPSPMPSPGSTRRRCPDPPCGRHGVATSTTVRSTDRTAHTVCKIHSCISTDLPCPCGHGTCSCNRGL